MSDYFVIYALQFEPYTDMCPYKWACAISISTQVNFN